VQPSKRDPKAGPPIEYSFVIPIHNEAETLRELARRLTDVMTELDGSAEVVLVDDGSRDDSVAIVRALHDQDQRFKLLRLSRNFGHQIAITAGMEHASGDAVIIMDADLQDPPEVVLEMARQWREGFHVVYGVRENRESDSVVKRLTASWFYKILSRLSEVPIPHDTGDFRLVDRRALEAVRGMREHRRYLRGMFAWIGFDQVGVTYVRPDRFAGTTKFSFRRMFGFALDGIVSFSTMPLRMTLNLGFFISSIAFLIGFIGVMLKIFDVYTVPGWASIVVAVALLGGVQLTVLGVIGEYIARIHEEVKQRPLYLVYEEVGLSTGTGSGDRLSSEREERHSKRR
jgi:dolichol-phosphate mannosyltransferase